MICSSRQLIEFLLRIIISCKNQLAGQHIDHPADMICSSRQLIELLLRVTISIKSHLAGQQIGPPADMTCVDGCA